MSRIYINTLNIFKPWRTYWANRKHVQMPSITCRFFKSTFEELKQQHYTWFWWDNDFSKTKLLVLIDDVFVKSKFGIIELEQVPFILVRIFNWNFLMKLKTPGCMNRYEYWENMEVYLYDEE